MSVALHPRWRPADGSERHPQTGEEWDYSKDPVGGALARSMRRLNVAIDYDDPRAPDQMALVLRIDLSRLMADRTHKNAAWESWRLKDPTGQGRGRLDESIILELARAIADIPDNLAGGRSQKVSRIQVAILDALGR